MYTAEILGKSISKEEKVVRFTVTFTNTIDSSSFNEDLKFGFDFTEQDVKRRIQSIINQLDKVQANVDKIAPGAVDLTGVTQTTETQEEIDTQKWFRQLNRLRAFTELKTLGGMPAAWQADLDALALKVQTDAKKTYLNSL